jgi:hypothetical protein
MKSTLSHSAALRSGLPTETRVNLLVNSHPHKEGLGVGLARNFSIAGLTPVATANTAVMNHNSRTAKTGA